MDSTKDAGSKNNTLELSKFFRRGKGNDTKFNAVDIKRNISTPHRSKPDVNPNTLKLRIAFVLPVIAIFIQACILLSTSERKHQFAMDIKRKLTSLPEFYHLLQNIYLEQSLISVYVTLNRTDINYMLQHKRNRTNVALVALLNSLDPHDLQRSELENILNNRSNTTSPTESCEKLKNTSSNLITWFTADFSIIIEEKLNNMLSELQAFVLTLHHTGQFCSTYAGGCLDDFGEEQKTVLMEIAFLRDVELQFAMAGCTKCKYMNHNGSSLENSINFSEFHSDFKWEKEQALAFLDNCSDSLLWLENLSRQHLLQILETIETVIDSTNNRATAISIVLILAITLCPTLAVLYIRSLTNLDTYIREIAIALDVRMKEMDIEKEKAENLLYRMLPKAVVEDLKHDKSVLAESYSLVTIYFSDIVGFTSISVGSTPMQVVDMLNKLYTEFDSRVDLYDVYKVETIGDAYMIVSGCPRTNGIRHAGEIATLSLDILNMIKDFKIPHMPEKKLLVRIGMHSGPCVAAVVGVKMPRYCLFGDAVNIACRMESTGQGLRIQMSEHSKELLDRLGKYDCEERGRIEVKENAFLKSFWLTGKDGYKFQIDLDVCVFIPKKVKLEKIVVKKSEVVGSMYSLRKGKFPLNREPSIDTFYSCDDSKLSGEPSTSVSERISN